MGATPCTVQLELRPSAAAAAAGGVQPTVSVKNKRDEVETMPLFSNKDTISGEVRGCLLSIGCSQGSSGCCQRRYTSACCAAACSLRGSSRPPRFRARIYQPASRPSIPSSLCRCRSR